jgi:pimeloyl-ACP methyl ester carboxylesterase
MPFYDINGQKIHAHETGKIGKQLVLLIHGWSSSWYAMSPLITHFHQRYHCVAVDLPGFGESPKSEDRASIETYADLMADLIQQITPNQKAILVGHSMGGMISLTMALRHPELVERMVLLCPTISGRLSLFMNLFISPVVVLESVPLLDAIAGLLEPLLVGITDRLMRPASLSERSGIKMEDYERLREDARRPGQGRIRAECFWAMRHGDLRGKLKNMSDIPALVIWGMEDNTVPLKDASALVQEWPDIDLRILPRVSHWPQFEAPEITRRHIKGFLSRPLNLIQAVF